MNTDICFLNELNNSLPEKAFSFKFKPMTSDIAIESIGYDDFIFVEEISFFRVQPFYTLHYVLRGKGTLYFNGKVYKIRAGQFFILPINQNIKYLPDKDDPWKYFWFDFSGNIAEFLFNSIYRDSPIISDVQPESALAVFKRLFYEMSTGTVKYFSALSCFYGVINLLFKGENRPETTSLVAEAKKFITLNFRSCDFTVEDLCRMSHISHSYLCKLFKKETGITVKSYLTSVRINEAVKLLKSSDMTVKDVAFSVGFFDDVNFMKSFKRHVGKTPSQYRQQF